MFYITTDILSLLKIHFRIILILLLLITQTIKKKKKK